MIAIRILLFAVLGSSINLYANETLHPFVTGSYKHILKTRNNTPFALVFWSIECAPCYKELAMLGKLKQRYPKLNLVLVSVDQDIDQADLQKVTKKMNLRGVESWLFSALQPSARLRYEVDPAWHGELPRSYLYDVNHRRKKFTGLLKVESVIPWLKKVRYTVNK